MKKWLTYENYWIRNCTFAALLFGLVFLRIKVLELPRPPDILPSTAQLIAVFLVLYGIVSLYNNYVVKRFLFKGKYLEFAGLSVSVLLLLSFVFHMFLVEIGAETSYVAAIFPSAFVLFFGVSVFLAHSWIVQKAIQTNKELHNREFELQFLKQQISPHFLFNALNNLYGVALAYPNTVADKILELSDLLRYQVESTKKERVPVADEVQFVESYINYTNFKNRDVTITNTMHGTVEGFLVPPLLFLPLIENAVKYSAETETPFVNVLWNHSNNSLVFEIENSYDANNTTVKGAKVGITNLEQRLKMYNISYELTVNTELVNVYKIQLKLWKLHTSV